MQHHHHCIATKPGSQNADFIAASRTALPALIEFAAAMLECIPAEHAPECPRRYGYDKSRCRCDFEYMVEAREKLARALEGK